MKKITFKEYKDEIKKQYEIAKREDVSGILNSPTPAQIRNLCSIICDNQISKADDGVFKFFFETKPNETLKRSIDNCNTDKFKPIISFLKGEKDSDNPTRIEIAAILVNYHPRPYSNLSNNYIPKEDNKELSQPLHLVKPTEETLQEIGENKQDEKENRNKKRILIFILTLLVLFCTGYVVKDVLFPAKECMQWQNDHYELVNCKCETEGFITQNQIKPIDSKEVTLRKIKVDKNTEFFKNGKPIIWYYKINNDSIEFYNNHGFHPINQKPLKHITDYIINKYVVNE